MRFSYRAVATATCAASAWACSKPAPTPDKTTEPPPAVVTTEPSTSTPTPPATSSTPSTPDGPTTDTFVQVQPQKADILWVVDNSCSMADEQDFLSEYFPLFFEFFAGTGIDYHIGVVSTDMDDPAQSGKLADSAGTRWITPQTVDPEGMFASLAELGTRGSGTEEGILAGYAAFELQPNYNAGFLRQDSAVHTIVVSDESDFSPDSPVTLAEYQDYLNGLRQDPDLVTYNGIVSPLAADLPCDGAGSGGDRYIETIEAVGGVFWSRCNPDWPGAMELLGLETAGLKREFFLSQVPDPATIQVSVETDGATESFDEYDPNTGIGDWTYSAEYNSVTFLSYIPEPGAEIDITYQVL